MKVNAPINLPAGQKFKTQLGWDTINGAIVTDYTVITDLGVEGDGTSTTLQGMKNALSGNFALGGNIDAADIANSGANSTATWNIGAGFAPIGDNSDGTNATRFTGKFDGLGHTISNLAINRLSTDYVGLFGYALTTEIKNVGLIGGSVSGRNKVGGLLGYNDSGSVSNSYSTGAVSGVSNVGGLVGENVATINASYSTATVHGSGNYVGGLVGGSGVINNSYSTGSVTGNSYVGGLAGGFVTVNNSYSTGNVTGILNYGGLVGGGTDLVTNSYWNTETSGQSTSAGGTGKITIQMNTQSTFTNEGWDFGSTWSLTAGLYPRLQNNLQTAWTLSGQIAGVTNKTISYALNGTQLANSTTDTNGKFSTSIPYGDITSSSNLLVWLSGADKAAVVTDGANVTGLSLSTNVLNVQNGTFSNSALGTLKGSLSDVDIPYSVSGSDLTSSIDFRVGQSANYNLDGVMTVSGLNVAGTFNVDTTTLGSLSATNGVSGTGTLTYKVSNIIPATLPAMTIDNLTFSSDNNLTVDNLLDVQQSELTLHALHNININSTVSAKKLTLEYNLSDDGDNYTLGSGVMVNLPDGASKFIIKDNSDYVPTEYAVISDVIALQNINGNLTGKYALGANIDATDTATWDSGAGFTPIGYDSSHSFSGKFDGLGHTISSLMINRSVIPVGLFGYATDAEIKNVGLTNANITGQNNVGALLGVNDNGTVKNSYNTGTGTVSGTGERVGGLLGWNDGTISNSYSTVTVSGAGNAIGGLLGLNEWGTVKNSYSTGAVSGTDYVGGLLGNNFHGTVSNSYSTGAVTGQEKVGGLVGAIYGANPTITNSYSTGLVSLSNGSTSTYVGGLVGYSLYDHDDIANTADVPTGTITNSYWDKETSEQAESAAGANGFKGIGLTTAEMVKEVSFTGFNFSGTWSIVEDQSYPYLTSNPLINRPSLLSWGGANCVTGVCFYPTSGNSWNMAANWSDLAIPDLDDDLIIGNYNVVLDVAGFAKSITINHGSLDITGSLTTTAAGITGTGAISYNITNDLELPAITANRLSVNTTETVTQSAPISASTLLLSGAGNYTLENTGNAIGTLAANGINELSFLNSSALTIGWVNDSISGITATGTISVATSVGNLTIVSNVTTTNTSSNAIVLNAGSSKLAGDKTGGQIGFSATPPVIQAIDPNSSNTGRVTFKSGDASNSSIAHYISPGNFRYNNVPVTDVNAIGNFAIYREQPTIIITSNPATKTYDGAAYSGGNGVTKTGFVNGDVDTILTGALTYSGTSQGAINAGTYAITPAGLTNGLGYAVSFVDGSLTINPVTVSVSPILNPLSLSGSRVYDGTTTVNAEIFTLGGLQGSDDLTLSGAGTIADKNVGTNKSVSLGTLALGNGTKGLASNYTFTGGTYTVNITPALLNITATGNNKTYDSTTSATVNLADNRISGDVFTTSYGSASFADSDVGTAKPITVSGIGISGTDASNYTFNTTTTTSADITAALLHAISLSGTRVYDGTTTVNAGVFTLSGLKGNDDLTLSGAGKIADKNVGTNKSVSLGTLALGNGSIGLAKNYTFKGGNYLVNITPANLTLSGLSANSKTYDANTTAALSGGSLAGVFSGDNVTLASTLTGQFDTKNVGTGKAVTVSNVNLTGTDANNYTVINSGNLSADITPASLAVTANSLSKTYGANEPVLTYAISGLMNGDSDPLTGALSRVSGGNVGTYAITQGTLSNSSANYNFSYTGANFKIDPASLNLATDSKTRLYGGENPIFTGTLTSGSLVNGDTMGSIGLTFSTDATVTSNVGDYQIIPTLENQNYIFTGQNGVLSITPASLKISNLIANSKNFDGKKEVTLSGGELIGLVNGDTMSLNNEFKAEFVDSKVGTAKAITISNIGLTGAAVNNYKVEMPTNLTADIKRVPQINWIGPDNNSWAIADNWDQGVIPDATQDVSIPTTSFPFIDISGNQEVKSLASLSSLHLANGSSIKINSDFTLFNQIILSGNGTVKTNLFTNEGFIKPGNSPGSITIDGDFVQTDNGTLVMEIENESPGGYDSIYINGNAKLGGTMQLVAPEGYKPSKNFDLAKSLFNAESQKGKFEIDDGGNEQLVFYPKVVVQPSEIEKDPTVQPIVAVISMLASQNPDSPLNNNNLPPDKNPDSLENKKKEKGEVIVEASAKSSSAKSEKPLGICQ
jgi:hypothetical protein